MTRDDFDYMTSRIDFIELSIANIINKIDKLFSYLETMEIEKMKKRQELAKLLQVKPKHKLEFEIQKKIFLFLHLTF